MSPGQSDPTGGNAALVLLASAPASAVTWNADASDVLAHWTFQNPGPTAMASAG